MNKMIISAMILTMAATFSFADEGEQEEPAAPAQVQEQVQAIAPEKVQMPEPEQVQAQAPKQVQMAAPEQARKRTPEQAEEQEGSRKVIKEVTIRTGTSNSVTGKVESVKPADTLTRPRSSMVIIDSAGEAVEFVVKALAVVYDSTGHFLSLDNVQPEQKVQVDYIKKPGKVKEAASIKILK